MKIEVLKKVSMPRAERNGGRNAIYPWLELKVGDSFVFPKDCLYARARSAATAAMGRINMKFALRTLENGRIGCWRVK